MDHKEAHHLRLYVLAALFFIVGCGLHRGPVRHAGEQLRLLLRQLRPQHRPVETDEAARGNITDRNGKEAGVQPLLLQPDL